VFGALFLVARLLHLNLDLSVFIRISVFFCGFFLRKIIFRMGDLGVGDARGTSATPMGILKSLFAIVNG